MPESSSPVIVDQFGRELNATQPKRRETVEGRGYGRAWSELISRTLDISTVVQYLTSADRGILRYQMEMFDRMIDRDPHLQSVLQTRRLAIVQEEETIVPDSEDDSRAIDAADMVREEIGTLGEWEDSKSALLDAVPKGISGLEIVWEPDWTVRGLNEIPSRLWDWQDPSELKVYPSEYMAASEPLQPNKFIIHSPRIKPGVPVRRGLMRALSVLWCIAHYALEDWAGYTEVFGMPLRLGKYGTNSTPDDIETLKAALKNLGSDAMGVIPENMEVTFPEPMSRRIGGQITPMEDIIKYAERKTSILVLGQHLTTEAESGTGTLAGGAQDRVRKDLQKADARQLAATYRRDFFRPLVEFRMGPDVPLPHWKLDLDDPIDEKTRAEVFSIAIGFGQPVSQAQVREELGLREPEGDDDMITAPAAEPAQFSTMAAADGPKPTAPVGSAQRANQKLANTAADAAGDALSQVVDLVAQAAVRTDSLEELLTRVKLAAPDLDEKLKSAGMSLGDFEDLAGRAAMTSDLNGRVAVDKESKV